MLALALAVATTAGSANAQLLVPQNGDQRGGPPHQEGPRQEQLRLEPQRPGNRGQEQRPQDRPQERQDRHEGPRAYDSRGHDRNSQQEWRRGDRIDREDWNHSGRVDYRERHLRQPPRGYEWREVNGAVVLGAIATGVIADILLNANR
jgi:Ni/Co efflux regulator RcnB